ncbi:hypothetical protein B2M26_07385 [Ferroacidibacillus organovorans]|uniref:Aspartate racemase n=2 Tax=Ferroacidibacillus organovorans TaxID=1765683 RepID=A0A1V4EUG6_9BACL|nr:hypothetical protein B2M26_07385 [Ferroacidibacillus organovorans]
MMKTLGVIAGLGPLAGAHFYRRLIEMSPAAMDSEHIPIILMADPTVPSRIEHLSGTGESPVPKLVEIAQKLVRAGAELIAIPSTTTSIYQEQIAQQMSVPMISLIEEVTAAIVKSQYRKIGIMGTTPTRTFRVYEASFRKAGLEAVYPDEETQLEITEIISAVKEASARYSAFDGRVHIGIETLGERAIQLAQGPWSRDVDGILLACTELPVIVPSEVSILSRPPEALFRSTDILAAAIIRDVYPKGGV